MENNLDSDTNTLQAWL